MKFEVTVAKPKDLDIEVTDEQIAEWAEFEICKRGTLSYGNPLSNYDLNVTSFERKYF